DHAEVEETRLARNESAKAALAKIDEFVGEGWIEVEVADAFRTNFERMLSRSRPVDGDGNTEAPKPGDEIAKLFPQILDAQRVAVRALHQEGVISETVRRKFERTLDLQESVRPR
ncbi:MAG: hypothetical protein ACRDHN_03410, partial [Thermomicrobiales bacterium]